MLFWLENPWINREEFVMAHIVELVPNDAEIEAMTTPKNRQAEKALQHKRQVKRRLEDYLERLELRRAMGLDDDDMF
jgi:hypothetical protein